MSKYLSSLLTLLILLSGCSTISSKNINVNNGKIGYVVPIEHNNQFCYLYLGITAFNNEYVTANLEPNYSVSYKSTLETAIKESGNTPVEVARLSFDDISRYFARSAWDHSMTITPEGVQYFKTVEKMKDTDFILVPWLTEKRSCLVNTGTEVTGQFSNINSDVHMYLLKSTDLSFSQARQIGWHNHKNPMFRPVNKFNPSDEDRMYLAEQVYTLMKNQVRVLINGNCCLEEWQALQK